MPIVAITSLDLPAALAPLRTIDHSGDLTDSIVKGGAVIGPTPKKGASKVDRKTLTKIGQKLAGPTHPLGCPDAQHPDPRLDWRAGRQAHHPRDQDTPPAGEGLVNARHELNVLQQVLVEAALQLDPELIVQLQQVNQSLWAIEDAIREQEQLQDFGPAFIQLARSVYRQNDRRTAIKREINTTYGSALVEEKSYKPY